jgi:hypothetical protein
MQDGTSTKANELMITLRVLDDHMTPELPLLLHMAYSLRGLQPDAAALEASDARKAARRLHNTRISLSTTSLASQRLSDFRPGYRARTCP